MEASSSTIYIPLAKGSFSIVQSYYKMANVRLFCIIVASLPFMFVSASHSSLDYDNAKTLSPAINNEKVNLSLYYETLCPYCASFISDNLVKVFQNDLDTIVNLRLVPWGNAFIVGNRTQCQVRYQLLISSSESDFFFLG